MCVLCVCVMNAASLHKTSDVLLGCWRMLDFDYMSSVLSSILSAKDEFSWPSSSVPVERLSTALCDLYPR